MLRSRWRVRRRSFQAQLAHSGCLWTDVVGLPSHVHPMCAGLSVSMHPSRPPAHDANAQKSDFFHPAALSDSLVNLPPSTLARFAEVQKHVRLNHDRGDTPGKDVLVCTLGTGSAMPTKSRNGTSPTVLSLCDLSRL